MYDIRTVIEDCRSMVCGGMKAGIDIWEAAVLPKLLFNSSCWLDISTTTMQELESLQLDFYRCLLAVGSGHPISVLGNRRVYDEVQDPASQASIDFEFLWLLLECEDFLASEGITNVEDYTQFKWKNVVKTKNFKLNRNDILIQMKPLKKIIYKNTSVKSFSSNLT